MPAPTPAPAVQMLQLLAMDHLVQAVGTMARLGLADRMAEPRAAADLAREVGAHESSLYRLLRALGAAGVVEELDGKRFALTALGATLRTGPGSLAPVAAMHAHPVFWQATGALHENVKAGTPGFRAAHGQGLFETLRGAPEAATWFDGAMSSFSALDAAGVVGAYDFGAARRVVDVGGGQGTLLAAVLAAHPKLQGTLLDQAHNVAAARARFAAAGLEGRAEAVEGDFFKHVPPGGDVYLLANVLQDWADDRGAAILRTIRAAMGPRSLLLVVEIVIEPGPRGAVGKLVDLTNMIAGGRTRTVDEHRVLLGQAGLRLQRLLPTAGAISVLEATP